MSTAARLLLSCVFTAHLVCAAAWWWLMPGGFPLSHPRFWVNRVLPLAVLALGGAYVWARYRTRDDVLRALGLALAAFWAAAAVSARVTFPVTFNLLWLLPFLGAACIALLVIRPRRIGARSVVGAALAAVVGAWAPVSQRGDDPSTRPLDSEFERVPSIGPEVSHAVVRLSDALRVQPNGGVVYVTCGDVHLDVEPMLTFISRSPDRCWTLLAPRPARVGPRRRVVADHSTDHSAIFRYADDGESRLSVARPRDPRVTEIEALGRLDAPVYSHLNSYCTITSMGHRRLELSFSPCPDVPVEVTPFDYPFGRPVRFAYLDAADTFRVVEARSAEKGPFRTLASGKLKRGEPLAVTLHDRGVPVARVTLEDWSAQLSTALSPTAGYGVPQNAVTFMLTGASQTSPAFISFELAGTGIGRGYDSVGHDAGVYRNRLRVERLTVNDNPGRD
jgi:hypothetical protein